LTGARTIGLVALVLVVRALATLVVQPSDDLLGWRWVESVLSQGGDPYAETSRLNWPPLWMFWIGLAGRIARATPLEFDAVVRALPCVADAVIALLLARRSIVIGIIYALHPVAVFTTGAQAQFDALPTLGLLLAVHAVGRGGGLAGLALGLGAGFKTWPVALAPVLAAIRLGRGGAVRLMIAAIAPPALLLGAVALLSPDGFARNVAGYASYPGWWGLTSLGVLFPGDLTIGVASLAERHGRVLVMVSMLAVAAVTARRAWSAQRATLVALLVFLAVTPGFGPQYLLWILPFALVAGRLAVVWHLLAGALALFEQLVVPSLALDPAYTAAEAALLHNEILNWARLPLWLVGIAWLVRLSGRSTTAGSGPTPDHDLAP